MLIEPPLEEYQRSGAVYDKYWSWDEVYKYTVDILYSVLMISGKNWFSNLLVYFKFCAFLNFCINKYVHNIINSIIFDIVEADLCQKL